MSERFVYTPRGRGYDDMPEAQTIDDPYTGRVIAQVVNWKDWRGWEVRRISDAETADLRQPPTVAGYVTEHVSERTTWRISFGTDPTLMGNFPTFEEAVLSLIGRD